jgi:tartrate dehydrogenase/decarboxylase/D-malate dehydrogenase
VLEAAARHAGFALNGASFPWSCAFYKDTGAMMPADGIKTLERFDAILLGAVGWPAEVPDAVSLHGLPSADPQGIHATCQCPTAPPTSGRQWPVEDDRVRHPLIRENTEGEYSGAGGRVHQGTSAEIAVETSMFTRAGVERISRFGFDQARKRRGKLASVTKSNAQKYSMVFRDEVTRQVAADYPDVESASYHVDVLAARMVMAPESLDVVVASNLFGDILTDLGAAIQGGLGFAASANINPVRRVPSMFEPVHGSAPDIAHLGNASPIAAIWSGAMMLEHLGEADAAVRVMAALEATTARGSGTVPGKKRTEAITAAVLSRLF